MTWSPVLAFHKLATGVTGRTYTPEWRATVLVRYAVAAGWIVPAERCARCGGSFGTGARARCAYHHRGCDDAYALDVAWVCRGCLMSGARWRVRRPRAPADLTSRERPVPTSG